MATSIRVMFMSPPVTNFSREDLYKRAQTEPSLVMDFSNKHLVGIVQPHVDTLVVTVCIGGFNVHKVMVDGGIAVEIMYLDQFKGIGLKEEDLESYGPHSWDSTEKWLSQKEESSYRSK